MQNHAIRFLPMDIRIAVPHGVSILRAQQIAGLMPDAPCGGRGTCGKCRVLLDGQTVLACQTVVERDMTVILPESQSISILTGGLSQKAAGDGGSRYALAVDIGTTTVAAYLMDGKTGALLSRGSRPNPQRSYGADVISRLQRAVKGEGAELTGCIRECVRSLMLSLASEAGISAGDITVVSLAGNTAMHHLLLGIDPRPLVTPPYMPEALGAMTLHPTGAREIRVLPNIAGFVGGDTTGCMLAADFDRLTETTLLIDIGTNGEMVLFKESRRIACSTAAGPAFEGAGISCGMQAVSGAVDRVWLEQGEIRFHVIGGREERGLCGSGLLDLIAVLLETGVIRDNGRMPCQTYRLGSILLTQKDVRQVQLAKAAIQTGIQLLVRAMGISLDEIGCVLLAGAFGCFLSPASACRIGMLPPILLNRIRPIGNAAGAGARMCALDAREFARAGWLAENTDFLELASQTDFQEQYVSALDFPARIP